MSAVVQGLRTGLPVVGAAGRASPAAAALKISGAGPSGTALQRQARSRGVGGGRGRRHLRVSAIGFDLPGADVPGAKSAEKHAEELTRAAASLLLYSGVLKGKTAQSFLAVLQLLQKGNPLSLVQSYGDLYRSLAADEAPSWGDHLLNEVIRGTDSPLARAAAAGKPTAHLRAAAAHDLDLLQQLAVLERTLATWVKDCAFGTTERWLEAASSLAPAGSSGAASDGGFGFAGDAAEPVLEALLSGGGPPKGLLAPLSEAQRAALRAELAGKWRWSEGIELLERYHAAHGYGLVSNHSVLTWSGKLQAQDALKGAHELDAAEAAGLVSASHPATQALVAALADFVAADPQSARCPPHVALCGPAAGRWLHAAWALQRGVVQHVPAELRPQAQGLRTLVLPSNQLGSLPELAWSLSQHPRARWVVLANGLGGGSAQSTADQAAMLSGYDGFSWPSNALLVGGFAGPVPEELAPVFRQLASIE